MDTETVSKMDNSDGKWMKWMEMCLKNTGGKL